MNVDINNANDDLLVKYLLGEATAAEQKEVQEWIGANAANKKYFDDFKLIWDQSKELAATTTVDEGEAWERLKKRIENEGAEQLTDRKVIPLWRQGWMRAAAILVLLAAGGWIVHLLTVQNNMQMLTAQSGGHTLTDTLPDGSIIVLNKNSTLTYPSKFSGDTRTVTLTGEAFFSVAHDKNRPFIITANNASINVVGTTFNVKTTDTKTEVIVETGIVEVAKKERVVRLVHDQKATVSSDKDSPEMENNTDQLYNYYRTGEFVCDGTPLWKLAAVLSSAYDVQITIVNPAARNMPITTVFHNEPLEDILKVISATLNLQVERRGSAVIIK